MKAYIVTIELVGSNPLIWRKVIMPADATFNRLHDVIQNVTNFQGGYPSNGYHLFEFNLGDLIVTNDEEAYEEHKGYKENKAIYDEILRTTPEDFLEFEKRRQERLKTDTRMPARVKIDSYLEERGEIKYLYDFGDGWEFVIKLEDTVDDYYFGYPTLLDGAETAPPEDVGGLDGFEDFLVIYRDVNHPEHKETKTWADSAYFKEYDADWINARLKGIMYKKTQWDKIEHKNYRIIRDKYRKSE